MITQKKADYLLFKKGVELLNFKIQKNIEGFRHIISLKSSMNKGLSDRLITEFPTVLPVLRPIVDLEGIPHSN